MSDLPATRRARLLTGTNTRNCKRTSKSGCTTCKTRKVKCDEGRPACQRCTSTGRVCEGYGIWGGGGNVTQLSKHAPIFATNETHPRKALLSTPRPSTQNEHQLQEWFSGHAVVKLQGAFETALWTNLVLPACLQEPSLFHAMLALSSVHRAASREEFTATARKGQDVEVSSLGHYNEAIRRLTRSQFDPEDRSTLRVILIACIMFICLESLWGRNNQAADHIRSGLKIASVLATGHRPGASVTGQTREDDQLVETFDQMRLARSHFQGYNHEVSNTLRFFSVVRRRRADPITFGSSFEARLELESFQNDVLQLTSRIRQQRYLKLSCDQVSDLEQGLELEGFCITGQQIRHGLKEWLKTYKASQVGILSRSNVVSRVGYELLFLYYTMTVIMVDTCTEMDQEMAFDSHIPKFATLLDHAVKFLQTVRALHASGNSVFGESLNSKKIHFNPDIGWITPLYYTAIHCRDPNLRRQAIVLLECIQTKEGPWSSRMIATVAREVVHIEEEQEEGALSGDGVWSQNDAHHGCTGDGSPRQQSIARHVPAHRRVHNMRVHFDSDDPDEKATMTFAQYSRTGKEAIMRKNVSISSPRTT